MGFAMAKTVKRAGVQTTPKRVAPKQAARAAKPAHILKANEIGKRQQAFRHPWNPRSEMFGVRMGAALGLKRLAVNIARLPAGHESYVPHAHQREEEWVYILMGEGVAVIDGKEHAIAMGDFLAFPAPQPAHQIKNTGSDDLVYLMGGEQLAMDVVDFPAHGKRMVWVDGAATAYDLRAGENPFAPPKSARKNKTKR